LLGDSEKARLQSAQLLSADYCRELAAKIVGAVKAGRSLPGNVQARQQTGTVHLNSADGQGNMVALTLTHGNAFGACVTVAGLGLILGHGMSRFDPHPDHPTAPGSGKRPLHNMCPTIVLREGRAVLALGATGGRMIPNAVLNVLAHFVA